MANMYESCMSCGNDAHNDRIWCCDDCHHFFCENCRLRIRDLAPFQNEYHCPRCKSQNYSEIGKIENRTSSSTTSGTENVSTYGSSSHSSYSYDDDYSNTPRDREIERQRNEDEKRKEEFRLHQQRIQTFLGSVFILAIIGGLIGVIIGFPDAFEDSNKSALWETIRGPLALLGLKGAAIGAGLGVPIGWFLTR